MESRIGRNQTDGLVVKWVMSILLWSVLCWCGDVGELWGGMWWCGDVVVRMWDNRWDDESVRERVCSRTCSHTGHHMVVVVVGRVSVLSYYSTSDTMITWSSLTTMFLLALLLVTLTGAHSVSVDPDMELPVRSETEEDIYIFNSMNINPLVN